MRILRAARVIKNVFKVLMIAAVTCFILFCGVKIVKGLIMRQPVARIFNLAAVTIADGAGSMWDEEHPETSLKPGDTILIKKEKDGYVLGQVITFTSDMGLVTHRIVEVTEGGYITKGDNPQNSVDTGVVTDDMVQGRMIKGPLSGVEKFFLSTWGFLTIALAFVVIYFVIVVIEAKLKDRYE